MAELFVQGIVKTVSSLREPMRNADGGHVGRNNGLSFVPPKASSPSGHCLVTEEIFQIRHVDCKPISRMRNKS